MKLDQHFMIDKALIDRIVKDYAEINLADNVLEIGAGTGNLTIRLSYRANKVIAIEIDEELVPKIIKRNNIDIIVGDALKILKKDNNLDFNKIVSNIPYSISEPLFNILITKKFELAVLTVSRKFSEKLRNVIPSRIGLLAHLFFDVKQKEVLSSTVFDPRPKVGSSIILLTPKTDLTFFENILKNFILRFNQLAKNALRESLTEKTNFTKRESRQIIDKVMTENEKNIKVSQLSYKQLERIIYKLSKIKKFK